MNNKTNELINKTDELTDNIKELDEDIVKGNSFHRVFLRGVFWGVGTAIGATIVAAIIISLWSEIIHSVRDIPILKDFVQNL